MIMKKFAILNFSHDSFSQGICKNENEAYLIVKKALDLGFYGIDIGISSTNPNANILDESYEIDFLKSEIFQKTVLFAKSNNIALSIDTIFPNVARICCENGFSYINDVNFLRNKGFVDVLNDFPSVKYVLTHSKSVPVKKDEFLNCKNGFVCDTIIDEMMVEIEFLTKNKISLSRIIVDPGVGFGKNNDQSWEIVQNFARFKQLNCQTYLAHSNKRFLSAKSTQEAAIATRVIAKMLEKTANYARLHIEDL